MLDDQELETAIEEEAQIVRELFAAHDGHAEVAHGMAAVLIARSEAALEQYRRKAPRHSLPVCQPRCAWCCKGLRVDVLAPEAFLVAAALRQLLEPDELDELRRRLAASAALSRGKDALAYARAGIDCPLLDPETALCSAYAARPMGCRGHSSRDSQACERGCKEPALSNLVPRDETTHAIFGTARFGLLAGLETLGLDSRPLELSAAVSIALETEDAEARWLEGEPIFDAAALSSVEADRAAFEAGRRVPARR